MQPSAEAIWRIVTRMSVWEAWRTEWDQKQNAGADWNPSVTGQGVFTGEMQDPRKFAAEVVGFSGSTEGESHGVDSICQSIESTIGPRANSHLSAEGPVHEERIMQRLAHGNISVIGHEAQEDTLSPNQSQSQEDLGATARRRDDCVMQKVVSHHLGHNGKREEAVDERELPKEEMRRDMKMGIYQDQQN